MKTLSIFLSLLILLGSYITGSSVMALEGAEISSPSAILMDQETGSILFERASRDIRPCASITKVMTLLLVMEEIEKQNIKLEDKLIASTHAASMGGSNIFLEDGEEMSVNDLIKATAVASANDAAVVLAEYISGSEEEFVNKMNIKAQELNMQDTVFKNCNGLDQDGHVTSALDVAIMSRELMKHKKIFDYTNIWMDTLRDGKTQIVNTNKLLKSYKGITGLKTGTTSQAGSCISATAERNSLSFIAVVLGAKNTKDRFADAAKLLDLGFSNYTLCKVPRDKAELKTVKVNNGMDKEVPVVINPEKEKLILEKGTEKNIQVKTDQVENVEAPVEQGQKLGTVKYELDGQTILEEDIVANNAIQKVDFMKILNLFSKALIKIS